MTYFLVMKKGSLYFLEKKTKTRHCSFVWCAENQSASMCLLPRVRWLQWAGPADLGVGAGQLPGLSLSCASRLMPPVPCFTPWV